MAEKGIMNLTKIFLWLMTILTVTYVGSPGESREVCIEAPSVCYDGTKLAFVEKKLQGDNLCVLDMASKKIQRIQNLPEYRIEGWYGASWSPDDSFVVLTLIEESHFTRLIERIRFAIWKVSIPHGEVKRIAKAKSGLCQRGLVSPDGKAILFRDAIRQDLMLINLGGGRPKYITDTGDTYRLGYDWSPDGSKIYFSRGFMADKGGFWVMNADGSEKMIISSKLQPYSLAISSSGEYVAFTVTSAERDNSNNPLFISRLKEFNPVKISQDAAYFFHWAPDNDALVFYWGRCEDCTINVWEVGSDRNPQEIGEGYYPVWAKQGQAIVFIRDKTELWEYEINSGKTTRIFSIKE